MRNQRGMRLHHELDGLHAVAHDIHLKALPFPVPVVVPVPGRGQAVGGSLTYPSVLRVGWVLRLPRR